MKKPNKKNLIKRLDKVCMALWHDVVFKRDNGTCQLCGKTHTQIPIHAHHIMSRRRHYITKHDPKNGILLCYYCHMVKIHQEGAQELGLWLIQKHGQKWFDTLKLQANRMVNDKLQHLETMKEYLLKELK